MPVVLGLLLQKVGNLYATKYAKQLALFDKSIILLIIYKSFCDSFESGIFASIKLPDLLLIFLLVVFLFFSILFFTGLLSKKLQFNREDQITAQFCGTKKSLVHGSVFYKILFQNLSINGFILLPIMVYHAFQILIISHLASQLKNKNH